MRAEAQGVVRGPAETVWRYLAAFDAISSWHPLLDVSAPEELPGPHGGLVRRLTTAEGELIREELLWLDDERRSLGYSFVESPFPVVGYRAEMLVEPLAAVGAEGEMRSGHMSTSSNCRILWSAEFESVDPADGPRLADMFAVDVFEAGIRALAEAVEETAGIG